MTATEICGAWGGCPLPKGHNMGRLDIPEYHAAPPAPDPKWVGAGVKALKDTWAEGADTDEDFAAAVIAAVAPLICADERERIVAELDGPAQESEAMYAHACEERDAARAEVERLRESVEAWQGMYKRCELDEEEMAQAANRWYDDLQEARAELAALREEVAHACSYLPIWEVWR